MKRLLLGTIMLLVVVLAVLGHRPIQGSSPEEDHLVEARGLDRSDEVFGVGVHIRRLVRRVQNLDRRGRNDGLGTM